MAAYSYISRWNNPKLFRLLGYSKIKFLSQCKDGFKKKSTLLVSPSAPPSVAGVAVVETPEVGDVSWGVPPPPPVVGVAVVEASVEGDIPGGVPLGVVVEETPGVGVAPLFRMSAIWSLYILPLMTFCWSQEASQSMNPPKFGSFFSFFLKGTILQNS